MIEKGCDAAICAGYYFKIPVVSGFPIVNIHPSLLPVGRGSWPMPQTILRGFKTSGVTIHKIAEGFDTGDILLQEKFNLEKCETHTSFMEKAYELLPMMLKALVENFDALYESAIPQSEEEYWEAPTEEDYTIDEDTSFEKADLILRAFLGYDCIYKKGNEKHIIRNAKAVRGENSGKAFKIKGGYII